MKTQKSKKYYGGKTNWTCFADVLFMLLIIGMLFGTNLTTATVVEPDLISYTAPKAQSALCDIILIVDNSSVAFVHRGNVDQLLGKSMNAQTQQKFIRENSLPHTQIFEMLNEYSELTIDCMPGVLEIHAYISDSRTNPVDQSMIDNLFTRVLNWGENNNIAVRKPIQTEVMDVNEMYFSIEGGNLHVHTGN